MSIQRPIYGFRFAEIQRGDTLQRIAARELGDAARWPDLVAYNSLVPPFVTDDATAAAVGVLVSGQFIRVPAPIAVADADVSPAEVFGLDVRLAKGRLEVVNGDFAVASGVENLKQALQHRVDTERGELIFHADYGSLVRRVLGSVNGPTAGILAAEYTKAALLDDTRVSSVSSASTRVTGDAVIVTAEVIPITGKAIDVAFTA